jgi:hypothetical protein
MQSTMVVRIALRLLVLAGAAVLTYLLLLLADRPARADDGLGRTLGAVTDVIAAVPEVVTVPPPAQDDTVSVAGTAVETTLDAVSTAVGGTVEAVLTTVEGFTTITAPPAAAPIEPTEPTVDAAAPGDTAVPPEEPEEEANPVPAKPVYGRPVLAPGRAKAVAVRSTPRAAAAARPLAHPAPASGLGGCTPAGCAQTSGATTAPSQPLALPGEPPARLDARGQTVTPVASVILAGRQPGVNPIPG